MRESWHKGEREDRKWWRWVSTAHVLSWKMGAIYLALLEEDNHKLAFGVYKIQIKEIFRRSTVFWILSPKRMVAKKTVTMVNISYCSVSSFPGVQGGGHLSLSEIAQLWTSKCLIYSVSAGLRKRHHNRGGLNHRHFFPHSSGGWKSEIEMSANLVSLPLASDS